MSFSGVASYAASDMFESKCENLNTDFFDEFLTFSPWESETIEHSSLQHESQTDKAAFRNQSGGTSPSPADDKAKRPGGHGPRRGESWDLSPRDTGLLQLCRGKQLYAELSGRAAISDSDILSLEGITLSSAQITAHSHTSLPCSPFSSPPNHLKRKNRIVESLSKTLGEASGSFGKSLRSQIRKASSSPAMKYISHDGNLGDLGRKFDFDIAKFYFDFGKEIIPLASPPCTRILDESKQPSSVGRKVEKNISMFSSSARPKQRAQPTAHDTTLSAPALEFHHGRGTSFQQPHPNGSIFPITPQCQSISTPLPVAPESNEFSTYEASTVYSAGIDTPAWWSHPASIITQPTPTGLHTNPQRTTKNLATQLQNSIAYNTNETAFNGSRTHHGLMIQMPDNHAPESFIMGASQIPQQGYSSATEFQPHHQATIMTSDIHAQLPPSSLGRKDRSRSRDKKPHFPGSPSPSLLQGRKRKSPQKCKDMVRTPAIVGVVDFVNFTPEDSEAILTGVAPSGSSKTKARREKVALEKRRKLSQAALRAVIAAGGDVQSLVEHGLVI